MRFCVGIGVIDSVRKQRLSKSAILDVDIEEARSQDLVVGLISKEFLDGLKFKS